MKPQIKNFIIEYLAELIEGNAAIFGGAGLSVPAGYVDCCDRFPTNSISTLI
jgi:hypothetical protein